jgi:hypothetical protein
MHLDTTLPVVTAPSRRMPGPPGTRYASRRPASGWKFCGAGARQGARRGEEQCVLRT